MKKYFAFTFFGVFLLHDIYAQNFVKKDAIKWMPLSAIKISEESPVKYFLNFEGSDFASREENGMPVYTEIFKISPRTSKLSVKLINPVFEAIPDSEAASINFSLISSDIKIKYSIEPAKPNAIINFVPIKKNELTDKLERLVSFDIEVSETEFLKQAAIQPRVYASSSVLATGDWYKIGVVKDGIYKMDLNFLRKMGIETSSLDPRNIRVYGNGGRMLPYMTTGFKIDDLGENAIYVEGENDGRFDPDDFILFYGESPNRWEYDKISRKFVHKKHLYTDTTYYFITIGNTPGKRIGVQNSLAGGGTPVTSFNDYALHELDAVNLVKSGREWYGELFENLNSYSFNFSFPNATDTISVTTDLCSRNSSTNTDISYTTTSGITSKTIIDDAGIVIPDPVFENKICNIFNYEFDYKPASSSQTITVTKNGTQGSAWLNYLELNARRSLIMTGNQMLFRDLRSVSPGKVSQFFLSNASQLKVWEVTDPLNVRLQNSTLSGNTLSFTLNTDSLREFIAFTGIGYLLPVSFGKISNQNLHAFAAAEMIIVAHPEFMQQAIQLADLHTRNDSLDVIITTPQEIYNEFSSGAQDVTAIRDFVKMIYDRSTSLTRLKYLLLFGDGSYNNKDLRTTVNTNFIPTFQSINSTERLESYVSDDYYGILEDDEGSWAVSEATTDNIDIGIGRLPVKSTGEAQGVVNKILNYVKSESITSKADCDISGSGTHGDWRNIICFMADDEDGNLHFNAANPLADRVDKNFNTYNIDKIYLDAFQQYSVAGGKRYPDATEALNRRVEKGALIINYTGHGGELGLTEERFLEMHHINSWKNFNRLPLFVTATCEFSRFDDPGRTSAGEDVLLNPNGGGIALLTTVRVVTSGENSTLNNKFYDSAFVKVNGKMPALGDLYRKTKRAAGVSVNTRNFTLLGDPALTLAYPKFNVVTTNINTIPGSDTVNIQALSKVTVTGYLADENNVKLSGFNGLIYPTVFDKALDLMTLANDKPAPKFPGSYKASFKLQKNILYKGKANVTNGDFSFSFIVPKDISFKTTGTGRISYYAHNGNDDAAGYFEKIKLSGTDSTAPNDITGPQVNLFMNDSNFVFGGSTNENPQIYAVLRDSNGISTAGTGIGHDIAAVLDGNTEKAIVLNDYYEADLNSYKSGKVRYNFSTLSEGTHNLKIKVWDVYNNSSQAYTEFIVAKSAELALTHVLNYPNPFTTKTKFFFEHNQACDMLDVQIQVFTISGKLVKTLDAFVHNEGFRSEGIDWDGRDEFGDKIGRGVYVYRLRVKTSLGDVADKFEKLVILN